MVVGGLHHYKIVSRQSVHEFPAYYVVRIHLYRGNPREDPVVPKLRRQDVIDAVPLQFGIARFENHCENDLSTRLHIHG